MGSLSTAIAGIGEYPFRFQNDVAVGFTVVYLDRTGAMNPSVFFHCSQAISAITKPVYDAIAFVQPIIIDRPWPFSTPQLVGGRRKLS